MSPEETQKKAEATLHAIYEKYPQTVEIVLRHMEWVRMREEEELRPKPSTSQARQKSMRGVQ